MAVIIAALAGVVFSLGLIVSGMANPAKVSNFLDLSGNWDPSLIFVMVGAIAVALPAYQLSFKRQTTLTGAAFQLPNSVAIDAPLLSGATLFGVGWGLSGFCPGPAVIAVVLSWEAMSLYFPAMLLGMVIARQLKRRELT